MSENPKLKKLLRNMNSFKLHFFTSVLYVIIYCVLVASLPKAASDVVALLAVPGYLLLLLWWLTILVARVVQLFKGK